MKAESVGRPATLRGTSVAGYVLEARLGGGGGGTVWRARGADGTAVAVKLLHAPLGSEAARRRFARERETLERLRHPAIVPLIASGVDDTGTGWLVTPLYAASLAERLASVGTLSPEETLRAGVRLALALARAHAHGVVHGDVKPANVLLDGEGRATLGDFGTSVSGDATLTLACGISLDWAAPERLGGAPPSVAADLFGLGATLRRALQGDARDEATALVPPALETLLDELVRPTPSERPAAADEVAERLAALSPDAREASTDCRSCTAGDDAALVGSATLTPGSDEGEAVRTTGSAHADPSVDGVRRGAGRTRGSAVWALDTVALPDSSSHSSETRRTRAGSFARALALAALAGGAVAIGVALGRERTPFAVPAPATLDCPQGAYLCERFAVDRGDWTREGDPDVARFAIGPRPGGFGADGALVRTAGTATEPGRAAISHPIAAPPPGGALRLRARLAIARDAADAPDVWFHVLQLEAANGQVWSVSVGGYGTSGMVFNGRYHDAGGPNDATFDSGVPRRVDAPLCLEAIVRASSAEDAPELAVYVDGIVVGALEHPPTAEPEGWIDRFEIRLGGSGVDPPDRAPEVVFDELVVDSGETPGCGSASAHLDRPGHAEGGLREARERA